MATTTRFFKGATGSYFLLGPRGTGKTVWTQALYPHAFRVDLLEPETLRALSARPERLKEWVLARPEARTILVDEVQKLPELLEVVHLLLQAENPRQFVLTGSSARKLRRGGVNLLAGRAEYRTLHPYLASEIGPDFDFPSALRLGMLPVVRAASDPLASLRAYTGLYLREEVQLEGMVRNLGGFARFLEAISFSHASTLNLASVARECQVQRKTVEGYLEVFEDLLLAFRLNVFTRRARRELGVHPKFYFFDSGVFRANRPTGPLDRAEEVDGLALEGLVAQHLRAWCDYSPGDHRLYTWQTRSKVEVDLVLYGEGGLLAIEVKNTDRPGPDDLRGLRAFAQDYPEARRILLHRGRERALREDILLLPAEDFLRNLRPGEFPSA